MNFLQCFLSPYKTLDFFVGVLGLIMLIVAVFLYEKSGNGRLLSTLASTSSSISTCVEIHMYLLLCTCGEDKVGNRFTLSE